MLGVDDLHASLVFYRNGLGLPTEGIAGTEFDDGAVVFFELEGGLKLALYPRKSLSKDAGIEGGDHGRGATGTFWGEYAGYFQSPDGHLWEVAWNLQMLPPG